MANTIPPCSKRWKDGIWVLRREWQTQTGESAFNIVSAHEKERKYQVRQVLQVLGAFPQFQKNYYHSSPMENSLEALSFDRAFFCSLSSSSRFAGQENSSRIFQLVSIDAAHYPSGTWCSLRDECTLMITTLTGLSCRIGLIEELTVLKDSHCVIRAFYSSLIKTNEVRTVEQRCVRSKIWISRWAA